jgi:hypothetical protein
MPTLQSGEIYERFDCGKESEKRFKEREKEVILHPVKTG